jgi:predicted DNA-binding protein (UPF0251 family)
MPRPKKPRWVAHNPRVTLFKPQGATAEEAEVSTLMVEGLEALRLVDMLGLDHEEAARRMGVSRPTLSRILTTARRLVAEALVSGHAILVEGGDYRYGPEAGRGGPHGRGGRGRGGHGRGRS